MLKQALKLFFFSPFDLYNGVSASLKGVKQPCTGPILFFTPILDSQP